MAKIGRPAPAAIPTAAVSQTMDAIVMGRDTRRIENHAAGLDYVGKTIFGDEHGQRGSNADERVGAQACAFLSRSNPIRADNTKARAVQRAEPSSAQWVLQKAWSSAFWASSIYPRARTVYGVDLLAATAIRLTKAATRALSPGSLIKVSALSGATH